MPKIFVIALAFLLITSCSLRGIQPVPTSQATVEAETETLVNPTPTPPFCIPPPAILIESQGYPLPMRWAFVKDELAYGIWTFSTDGISPDDENVARIIDTHLENGRLIAYALTEVSGLFVRGPVFQFFCSSTGDVYIDFSYSVHVWIQSPSGLYPPNNGG